MSCQIGCYKETPGLRVRRVAEMRTCLAYVPGSAQLFTLNLDAWLIFELARSWAGEAMVDAYCRSTGLAAAAGRIRLSAGLEHLLTNGIIEPAEPAGGDEAR